MLENNLVVCQVSPSPPIVGFSRARLVAFTVRLMNGQVWDHDSIARPWSSLYFNLKYTRTAKMGVIGNVTAFTMDETNTNAGVMKEKIDSPDSIISMIVLGFINLNISIAKGAMVIALRIIDATISRIWITISAPRVGQKSRCPSLKHLPMVAIGSSFSIMRMGVTGKKIVPK